jgi:ATP/maltotriose-dependent transcriptional regulator MalT
MIVEPAIHSRSLEQGRAALERGAWEEARAALNVAVAETPADGSAWESLAYACTWLQDMEREIDARQRAYTLYREQADDTSAARVCLDLVYDFLEVRGEPAVANGWLQRARRLLEGIPHSGEHALLRIYDAYGVLDADPPAAEAYARDAVAIARAVGAHDIAVLALAVHGLALVSEGKVADGMRLLDEAIAAAVGREISDPQWYYFACCCMIDACDRVRDFTRSLSWCDQLREFAERWRVQTFLTTCRIKYTGALLWRGDWQACEKQLEAAIAEMTTTKPGGVAGAVVRLAELRRRQGRRAEAITLLEGAGAHPLALLVRASLALDSGDVETALDLLDTLLRHTTPSARTERMAALELKTRAHAGLGQLDQAQKTAEELKSIAELIDTQALRATALVASGISAAANLEHEQAKRCFEDAVYLLESSGSRYEAARVRVDLAPCLAALGRHSVAVAEASAALGIFESLGAAADAEQARELMRRVTGESDESGHAKTLEAASKKKLTRRQREILALVSHGLSDHEIAQRLFLSEHTVHRHIANILMRLGVSTRTAAVASALRAEMI